MVELQYFGHSFFKLKDKNGTILIDPIFDTTKTSTAKIKKIITKKDDFKDVSLILITNEMQEHFDKEAVEQIVKNTNAIVVAHDSLLTDLNVPRSLKTPIGQGSEIFLKGFKISAKTSHCPQCFCPTGYLIESNGKKVYHAGVTNLLDSFSRIRSDVVILPMNNRSMDVVDVVRAAKLMKPTTLIPMQYDIFDFGKFDPKELDRRIKESVLNTKTVILTPGKKIKV
jgi:L-ascorbate metabolism protein UlaG (beta-lactamase superfamily)